MRTTHRKSCPAFLLLLMAVALAACGGGSGGGSGGGCRAGVKAGFQGDLEARYPRPGDRGGDSGPGSGSNDSSTDAGAGGGLGKVLGALVRVTRIADGSLIGEAYTDNQDGLVTITTCGDWEPLLVTLKGAPGAQYFDEGKNALVDFDSDHELHALVERLDENIGVTPFTEAAYRYALNSFMGDREAIAVNPGSLRKSGSLVGLSPEDLRRANQGVLNEINRLLPDNYHLKSLTTLPTPFDQNDSSRDALTTSRNGLAAVVTGGFVRSAARFRLDADLPALEATEHFSRDLTDGRIDGFALDGTPASQTGLPSYDSLHLPIALSAGSNSVAEEYSPSQNFEVAPPATEFAYVDGIGPSCIETATGQRYYESDGVMLLKDGSVTAGRTLYTSVDGRCVREDSTIPRFAVDIKQVFSARSQGFLVNTTGQVLAWGDGTCGSLGNGQSSGYVTDPTPIDGLHNITSISTNLGRFIVIARDGAGHVYSWGHDIRGSLGLGPGPRDIDDCITRDNVGGPANLRPRRIPTLSDIVTVYAEHFHAYAVHNDGTLYGWGEAGDRNTFGEGLGRPDRLVPAPVAGVTLAKSVAFCDDVTLVLRSNGTVIGWGQNQSGCFGDGTTEPRDRPTLVPELDGLVQLVSAWDISYALKADGTVLRWAGVNDIGMPVTPTEIPDDLPPVRHMSTSLYNVYLYTQDGHIWRYGYHGKGPEDITSEFGK